MARTTTATTAPKAIVFLFFCFAAFIFLSARVLTSAPVPPTALGEISLDRTVRVGDARPEIFEALGGGESLNPGYTDRLGIPGEAGARYPCLSFR